MRRSSDSPRSPKAGSPACSDKENKLVEQQGKTKKRRSPDMVESPTKSIDDAATLAPKSKNGGKRRKLNNSDSSSGSRSSKERVLSEVSELHLQSEDVANNPPQRCKVYEIASPVDTELRSADSLPFTDIDKENTLPVSSPSASTVSDPRLPGLVSPSQTQCSGSVRGCSPSSSAAAAPSLTGSTSSSASMAPFPKLSRSKRYSKKPKSYSRKYPRKAMIRGVRWLRRHSPMDKVPLLMPIEFWKYFYVREDDRSQSSWNPWAVQHKRAPFQNSYSPWIQFFETDSEAEEVSTDGSTQAVTTRRRRRPFWNNIHTDLRRYTPPPSYEYSDEEVIEYDSSTPEYWEREQRKIDARMRTVPLATAVGVRSGGSGGTMSDIGYQLGQSQRSRGGGGSSSSSAMVTAVGSGADSAARSHGPGSSVGSSSAARNPSEMGQAGRGFGFDQGDSGLFDASMLSGLQSELAEQARPEALPKDAPSKERESEKKPRKSKKRKKKKKRKMDGSSASGSSRKKSGRVTTDTESSRSPRSPAPLSYSSSSSPSKSSAAIVAKFAWDKIKEDVQKNPSVDLQELVERHLTGSIEISKHAFKILQRKHNKFVVPLLQKLAREQLTYPAQSDHHPAVLTAALKGCAPKVTSSDLILVSAMSEDTKMVPTSQSRAELVQQRWQDSFDYQLRIPLPPDPSSMSKRKKDSSEKKKSSKDLDDEWARVKAQLNCGYALQCIQVLQLVVSVINNCFKDRARAMKCLATLESKPSIDDLRKNVFMSVSRTPTAFDVPIAHTGIDHGNALALESAGLVDFSDEDTVFVSVDYLKTLPYMLQMIEYAYAMICSLLSPHISEHLKLASSRFFNLISDKGLRSFLKGLCSLAESNATKSSGLREKWAIRVRFILSELLCRLSKHSVAFQVCCMEAVSTHSCFSRLFRLKETCDSLKHSCCMYEENQGDYLTHVSDQTLEDARVILAISISLVTPPNQLRHSRPLIGVYFECIRGLLSYFTDIPFNRVFLMVSCLLKYAYFLLRYSEKRTAIQAGLQPIHHANSTSMSMNSPLASRSSRSLSSSSSMRITHKHGRSVIDREIEMDAKVDDSDGHSIEEDEQTIVELISMSCEFLSGICNKDRPIVLLNLHRQFSRNACLIKALYHSFSQHISIRQSTDSLFVTSLKYMSPDEIIATIGERSLDEVYNPDRRESIGDLLLSIFNCQLSSLPRLYVVIGRTFRELLKSNAVVHTSSGWNECFHDTVARKDNLVVDWLNNELLYEFDRNNPTLKVQHTRHKNACKLIETIISPLSFDAYLNRESTVNKEKDASTLDAIGRSALSSSSSLCVVEKDTSPPAMMNDESLMIEETKDSEPGDRAHQKASLIHLLSDVYGLFVDLQSNAPQLVGSDDSSKIQRSLGHSALFSRMSVLTPPGSALSSPVSPIREVSLTDPGPTASFIKFGHFTRFWQGMKNVLNRLNVFSNGLSMQKKPRITALSGAITECSLPEISEESSSSSVSSLSHAMTDHHSSRMDLISNLAQCHRLLFRFCMDFGGVGHGTLAKAIREWSADKLKESGTEIELIEEVKTSDGPLIDMESEDAHSVIARMSGVNWECEVSSRIRNAFRRICNEYDDAQDEVCSLMLRSRIFHVLVGIVVMEPVSGEPGGVDTAGLSPLLFDTSHTVRGSAKLAAAVKEQAKRAKNAILWTLSNRLASAVELAQLPLMAYSSGRKVRTDVRTQDFTVEPSLFDEFRHQQKIDECRMLGSQDSSVVASESAALMRPLIEPRRPTLSLTNGPTPLLPGGIQPRILSAEDRLLYDTCRRNEYERLKSLERQMEETGDTTILQGLPLRVGFFTNSKRTLIVGDGNLSFGRALCRRFGLYDTLDGLQRRKREMQRLGQWHSSLRGGILVPQVIGGRAALMGHSPTHQGIVESWKEWGATNLTVTCYESAVELLRRYPSSGGMVAEIEQRGAMVLYNVDACNLRDSIEHSLAVSGGDQRPFPVWKRGLPLRFDVICWNFPQSFAKSHCPLTNGKLVEDFLASAKQVLIENGSGKILVTLHTDLYSLNHERAGNYREQFRVWRVEERARRKGLVLSEVLELNCQPDYPGYGIKNVVGNPFNIVRGHTYCFILDPMWQSDTH